jgi:hypothetical protein
MSGKKQWTFVSKEELDKIIADSFSNNLQPNPELLRDISSGVDRFLQEQKKDAK